MDDFINPFPSPPTWPNDARSSWNGAVATQSTNLLADSIETYGEGKRNSSSPVGSSNHVVGIATNDDFHVHDGASSIFIGRNLTYDIDKHQNHVERSYQDNSFASQISSRINDRCFHIHDDYNSTTESLESSLPQSPLAISDSMGSNIPDFPAFQQPLADSTLWPLSYAVDASLVGQDTIFHGVGSNDQVLMRTFDNGKFTHGNGLPTFIHPNGSIRLHDPLQSSFSLRQQINSKAGNLHPRKEGNGLNNLRPSSFPIGETVSSRMTGIQSSQQSVSPNAIGHQLSTSQAQPINPNPNGSHGTAKSRVRARRGQATDPHSIAERLRRERISERMKNLQELVPNSNKTDKASMLDEIIDYVKFLQLQVKVLSMSRIGATGAVVPLLTDTQAERSGSLLSASSLDQGVLDLSDSEDNLAFEQEVVKLMETNVTSAMQYLQNKGLCLMPTALASAISNQKGSSVAVSSDWRKAAGNHVTITRGSSQECSERSCADGPNCYNGDILKQEAAQEPSEK